MANSFQLLSWRFTVRGYESTTVFFHEGHFVTGLKNNFFNNELDYEIFLLNLICSSWKFDQRSGNEPRGFISDEASRIEC